MTELAAFAHEYCNAITFLILHAIALLRAYFP